MKDLIIFGTDDMAEVIAYLFEHDVGYRVAAFTVDHAYRNGDTLFGRPLCDFETVQEVYPPERYDMFIAIGYSHMNQLRAQKYHEAKAKGYRLASYVSSRATCFPSMADIGDNTFIFEDNTIQPFVKIGSNVILWSGNHVGHHARIGDHVFVTSHVVLSGRTVVGDYAFIGVNSTVHDHVRIGERCVIGSGALITRDTEPGGVYKAPYTPRYAAESSEIKYFEGNRHHGDH